MPPHRITDRTSGRSNVGKSTLLNALTESGLAHCGDTPGMTRKINFYKVANSFVLVDLPGYGFAYRNENETLPESEWQTTV